MADALSAVKSLVETIVPWQTWLDEQTKKAAQIALCRKYAKGEHRASLTPEMRNMLRIAEAEVGSPFNINHLDNIIQTVADRLEVSEITADTPEGTKWLGDLLRVNNFDGLQADVQEAMLRDGDTYVMVDYLKKDAPDNEEEEGYTRFTQEDAYDGVEGVVMVYGTDKRKPKLALKIWPEMLPGEKKTSTRINAYYPDHVDKYTAKGSTALVPYVEVEDEPREWKNNGRPLGIPIIHFRNRGGRSEIDPAIPLQDAINRTMVSMVMASELTAFQIRYAIGIEPPAGLTPGMWIRATIKDKATGLIKTPDDKEIAFLNAIRFGNLQQGELMPFLAQCEFMIDQMYTITRTPRHNAAKDASGESLKQKEIGLVGKVKRVQVSAGNAWESVARLAYRVTSVFGTKPPEAKSWSTHWRSAEIRNDNEVIDNALKIADRVDERTLLTLVASVYGWDTATIDAIMKAKRGDAAARTAAMAGNTPRFGGGNMNGVPLAEEEEDLEDAPA